MTRNGKSDPGRELPEGTATPSTDKVRRAIVALADGRRVSLADLPPTDTQRWVASRKELVAIAVHHGLLTAEEACARYDLSLEELEGWIAAWMRDGRAGLRISARRRPGARRGPGRPAGSHPRRGRGRDGT